MVRSEAEKALIKRRKRSRAKKSQSKTKKKNKSPGRPKGSKNKDKNEFTASAELSRINGLLQKLLKLLRKFIAVRYLAVDGHFGHNQAVLMARLNELHLISKMRRDAALWEKYDGKYKGKGRKNKYGKKLHYEQLPHKYWKKINREGELITNYYQAIFLHKEFGGELNVVIIERVNLKTGQIGHAILFSSDVELGSRKVGGLLQFAISDRIQFSGCQAAFRIGRFYESDGNRSGKCGKYGIFDGQYEREIDKKQRRKMRWSAGLKNALSRSKIRGRSNKNTSRKSRNDYKERGN